MHDTVDLLDVMASDYDDYARKILKIIFTPQELKDSILPPGRRHLARPPLDEIKFKKFTGK
jgi:hypothetical protein